MNETTKREIKFFVSYAHENERLATSFIKKFIAITKPAKNYEYSFWTDKSVLAGQKWKDKISKALKECTLGLLLVSPEFLASEYITKQELPRFVGNDAKPLIPVMLLKVNLKRHDLKGLEEIQIFMLEKHGFKESKAYSQCSTKQRDDFINDLYEEVESRLDTLD